MKKKVLHLITGVELGGGAENMLFQLLPKMQENLDNRVCVIMGRGEIGNKLEENNIKVYYLDFKNYFDLIKIIFRYRKILKDFSPDIQVNYLIHADIFGRIFGKIFKVKKIVSYIRNIHKKKKFLMFLDKATLFLVDFVLTNSNAAREYYLEKMGTKKERIKCIPNAIDVGKFQNSIINRNGKLKELKIKNPDANIIVSNARMEKQKDIPTLIKAFKKISEEYKKIYLLLIGHGNEKGNIKNLVNNLKLTDKVIFLEKRKDVAELLAISDIFVLPSLNEGMSNALLEAMASKKIIITSNISENVELIRGGQEGFNFKAGDSYNLAKRLQESLKNINNLDNLKENAFKKVVNLYSLDKIKKDYEAFLLGL